jgi:hypothetical protein
VKGDRDTRIRLAPFEPARWLSEIHDHLNAEDLSFFPKLGGKINSLWGIFYAREGAKFSPSHEIEIDSIR